MPYPSVTALPTAPSRTGDSTNFVSRAATFLNAFPTWRTQSNALGTYLNALPMLKYQWGLVTGTNPTRQQITPLPARPSGADTGLTRTSKTDAVEAALQVVSTQQNLIGIMMDALSAQSGAVMFIADASRPVVPSITVNPARSNDQATFESRAITFHEESALYAINEGTIADYYYNLLNAAEDWGLITQAVTDSDDFGSATGDSDG